MDNKIYRLRSSVAISYNEPVMGFFKTNVREMSLCEISSNITEWLRNFDAKTPLKDILQRGVFEKQNVLNLIDFLVQKHVLIEVDKPYDDFSSNYRLINFLEDFCFKTSQVLECLNKLQTKVVMIVGLGAVGSYIADILARSGVRNFILVDDDRVELSNLHRQHFYKEKDVGLKKIDCIEREWRNYSVPNDFKIFKIDKKLTKDFFKDFNLSFDLCINCADYPSVDITSEIIAKECMKRKIPHIIGGGYNLHLSLIGQSILPFESACYGCFDIALQEINAPYTKNLKKLYRENRKIGSFSPMCSLVASLTAMESFKIICDFKDKLVHKNRRIEFKMCSLDFEILEISKKQDCSMCGV
ncbi:HesA/MoeB/ThiF family protein [Helicobacter cetorum]|uniref:UBA/THIF-type NAD/FAD binding protein n=1 Tax=Helicobacter cetorum (strain ATCC BAA-429 / MIT 00-7128) TaxID=182217 RepID=I0EPC5_HELC0|nr:ThiF family adenylyltransferase [Helicobacter cetorum]AFI04794.1 UBA/THIF-type NAD/FAD binding protein [Helicobacter cetorum MIT 00-7128]